MRIQEITESQLASAFRIALRPHSLKPTGRDKRLARREHLRRLIKEGHSNESALKIVLPENQKTWPLSLRKWVREKAPTLLESYRRSQSSSTQTSSVQTKQPETKIQKKEPRLLDFRDRIRFDKNKRDHSAEIRQLEANAKAGRRFYVEFNVTGMDNDLDEPHEYKGIHGAMQERLPVLMFRKPGAPPDETRYVAIANGSFDVICADIGEPEKPQEEPPQVQNRGLLTETITSGRETFRVGTPVGYGINQTDEENDRIEAALRIGQQEVHTFTVIEGSYGLTYIGARVVMINDKGILFKDCNGREVAAYRIRSNTITREAPAPTQRAQLPDAVEEEAEHELPLFKVGVSVEHGLMPHMRDNIDIEEELRLCIGDENQKFTVKSGPWGEAYTGATVVSVDPDGEVCFKDHLGKEFRIYRTTSNTITREAPAQRAQVEEKEAEEKPPAKTQFPIDSDQGAFISRTQVQVDQHRELLADLKVGDRCNVTMTHQDAGDPRPANSMCEVVEIRVGDLYFAITLRPLTGQDDQEEFTVGAMDIVTIKRIKEEATPPPVTQAAANEDQVLQLGTVEGKLPDGCKPPQVLKFSSGSSDLNSKSWDVLQKLEEAAFTNEWKLRGEIKTDKETIDCLSISAGGRQVVAFPKDSPGERHEFEPFQDSFTVTITGVDAFPIRKKVSSWPGMSQPYTELFDGLVYPGRYHVRIDKQGKVPKIFDGAIKGKPVVEERKFEITFRTTDGKEDTVTEKDDVTIERLAPPIEVEGLLKIGDNKYEFTVGDIGSQRNRDFLAWLKYEDRINRRVELQGKRSQDTLLETRLDNEGLCLMIGMSWITRAPGEKLQIKFL